MSRSAPQTHNRKFFQPLIQKQAGRNVTLCEYWGRHLTRGPPCPEFVAFANGALFSVAREQITVRPRAFYSRLLDDGIAHFRDPFQAYYLETMWAYIFFHPRTWAHARADEFCPRDVAPYPRWAEQYRPRGSARFRAPRPGATKKAPWSPRLAKIEYTDDDGDRVQWLLGPGGSKHGSKSLQKYVRRKGRGDKAPFQFQATISELHYNAQTGELYDNRGMGGVLPARQRRGTVSKLHAFASAANVKWSVLGGAAGGGGPKK